MRRYTFEQIEVLYYLSRKSHRKLKEMEFDMHAKAIVGHLGEAFGQVGL